MALGGNDCVGRVGIRQETIQLLGPTRQLGYYEAYILFSCLGFMMLYCSTYVRLSGEKIDNTVSIPGWMQ